MASIPISHASPLLPSKTFTRQTWSNSFPTKPKWRPKQLKRQKCLAAGGFPTPMDEESGSRNSGKQENQNWDPSHCEALLKGGQQVTSVLAEMAKLLEDMNMDEAYEEVAIQLAAQGVIGKRVDEMESGFMMASDYMIQIAEKDQDEKAMIHRRTLLEVVKETVLSHLTKKCPPHVQMLGLPCRTPGKES